VGARGAVHVGAGRGHPAREEVSGPDHGELLVGRRDSSPALDAGLADLGRVGDGSVPAGTGGAHRSAGDVARCGRCGLREEFWTHHGAFGHAFVEAEC
jgi:hypothetical protein